jgi:hypothetical protein
MNNPNRTCTLYRYFDNSGALLYVGITNYGDTRLRSHARSANWWRHVATATFTTYPTATELVQAERLAIRDEQPMFNIARHRPTGDIPNPLGAPQASPAAALKLRASSITSRQQLGRYGGLKSWANTVDRTARTANGRRLAPGAVDWHIARLGPEFASASEAARQAAGAAARRAYFTALALKSATARSRH